jgi:hypothetical protein
LPTGELLRTVVGITLSVGGELKRSPPGPKQTIG